MEIPITRLYSMELIQVLASLLVNLFELIIIVSDTIQTVRMYLPHFGYIHLSNVSQMIIVCVPQGSVRLLWWSPAYNCYAQSASLV